MTGTVGKLRVVAAAVTAGALTGLVFVQVHPDRVTARAGTISLAVALWAVFAAGVWLIRRAPRRWAVALIVAGGIAIQLAALSAPPQGSDDLYRYIWDGRVQAAGIDPYQYQPAAPQLVSLRDPFLWSPQAPHCVAAGVRLDGAPSELATPGCTRINRPIVHTIYPPVAEAYFLAVHYLTLPGSGSTPIQAAAALCAVALTLLLLYGLRKLGRDPTLAVLWAWCPTVALEAGNNGHVDVLAAGITAAALILLARPGRLARPLAGGALLALAIWTKVTPVLVGPAVLRRRRAALIGVAAFATAVVYLPHVLAVGSRVIGFLPGYLHQEGYADGTRFLLVGLLFPGRSAFLAAFAVLVAVALIVLRRGDPDQPWRGALVMTGVALAVATPPFPWYAMLAVMLVAFDGRVEWLSFAMVRYFAVSQPLPDVQVPVLDAERVGYAVAVAVVAVVSLIRWRRGRKPVPTGPVPAELASAERVSAEPVSAEPVSAERVSAERVPAERVPAEPVPAERVSAERVSAEPAPSQYLPGALPPLISLPSPVQPGSVPQAVSSAPGEAHVTDGTFTV